MRKKDLVEKIMDLVIGYWILDTGLSAAEIPFIKNAQDWIFDVGCLILS